MGLNRKRGRIPNVIKEAAKQAVDEGLYKKKERYGKSCIKKELWERVV